MSSTLLPTTTPDLNNPDVRPYFLWWTPCTVREFRQHLTHSSPEHRAYWLAALLREANTRDVWLFATPRQIRANWPYLVKHLGRMRKMWAWLLGCPDSPWPPQAKSHA